MCVAEITRLRLAEAGALKRAAERLEGIDVRHEREVAKPRADQLRQRWQQARAHHGRFATARCAEHKQHIARAKLCEEALDELIAAKEEVFVPIFKAIQPAIGRDGNERSLRDCLDGDLYRRGDVGDLVATDDVTQGAEVDAPSDVPDVNPARLESFRWRS